jgi:hypothetical protein
MVGVLDLAHKAGDDIDARRLGQLLRSILSPIAAIAPTGGPMKAMFSRAKASAKEVRSERKP